MGLDVDKYERAPDDLTLEQVHVYVRHGERTPVASRMTPFITPYWPLCALSSITAAEVLYGEVQKKREGDDPSETFRVGQSPLWRVAELPDMSDQGRGMNYRTSNDVCGLGQLTDHGVYSTSKLGQALRQLYVDRLDFLPPVFVRETAYFRSTDMSRTIASLHHLLFHLYPPGARTSEEMPPMILVRSHADEDLMQNYTCKRFRTLQDFWMKAALPAINPSLSVLNAKLSKYIDDQPILLDGNPKLSGILDTIKAAERNFIAIPSEFKDPDVVQTLERAVVAEWFGGYRNKEISTLGVGRVLADLRRSMAYKVKYGDKLPLRLRILSCHDTTVAAILIALDDFDGKWPDFTSYITFELFRQQTRRGLTSFARSSPPSEPSYYVRARYQNRNLVLPACSAAKSHLPNHPEFCTFEAFSSLVKTMTPSNWKQQCQEPLKEPPDFSTHPIYFDDKGLPPKEQAAS